jgi:flagellar basal-body rod modification protein FlgD
MAITGVDSVQSQPAESQTTNTNILGKDHFLNLLVAQLKHQDPLNPMDSTGFTAQLAQFSSLEQLQNVNSTLENMASAQTDQANNQAVYYIGKSVTARGNTVQLGSDLTGQINFELKGDAQAVFVNIYDSFGRYVRNIETGPKSAGYGQIDWDGRDSNGNMVPQGSYTYEMLAVNADNDPVAAESFATGRITGVNFKNGTAYLMADSLEIPLDTVIRVSETTDE